MHKKIRACLLNTLPFSRIAASLPNCHLSLYTPPSSCPDSWFTKNGLLSPPVMSCERGVVPRLLWSLPCDRQVQYSAALSDLPGFSNYDTFAQPCSISTCLTTLSLAFFSPHHAPWFTLCEYSFKNFLPRHCLWKNNWGKVMTYNVRAAQEYELCDEVVEVMIGSRADFYWANEAWKCSIKIRISLFSLYGRGSYQSFSPFCVVSWADFEAHLLALTSRQNSVRTRESEERITQETYARGEVFTSW